MESVALSSSGVYLPATRVTELGWRDSLPTFSGWHQAFGLPLTHVQVRDGQVLPAIRFTDNTAAIVLPGLPNGANFGARYSGLRARI